MKQCEVFEAACDSSWAYHTEYLGSRPGVSFINCKDTGVQYFIEQENDKLTVIFRGTDSAKDLFWDSAICQRALHSRRGKPKKSKVHRGFLTAYEASGVSETIGFFITPLIKNIVVTGHSYGAALAVLCAADLQSRFPELRYKVIVFGCPRVGNHAFCSAYNRRLPRTLRVENGNDAVTKVPFPELGYRHVGNVTHIGKKRRWWKFSFKEHAVSRYVQGCYEKECRVLIENKAP